MMKSISYFFLLLLIISGCQQDESVDPELEHQITISAIGVNGATFTAELKDLGIYESLQHGFLWSAEPGINIVTGNKFLLGSITGGGEFSTRADNFEEGKEYFIRGFVADKGYSKVFYTQEVSFSTLKATTVIETLPASDISATSVRLNGNLLTLLQYNSLQYGFVYSTDPLPDLISSEKIIIGEKTSPGNFTATAANLQPGTTYHVRAFATDAKAQTVFYGLDLSFTTIP